MDCTLIIFHYEKIFLKTLDLSWEAIFKRVANMAGVYKRVLMI